MSETDLLRRIEALEEKVQELEEIDRKSVV